MNFIVRARSIRKAKSVSRIACRLAEVRAKSAARSENAFQARYAHFDRKNGSRPRRVSRSALETYDKAISAAHPRSHVRWTNMRALLRKNWIAGKRRPKRCKPDKNMRAEHAKANDLPGDCGQNAETP